MEKRKVKVGDTVYLKPIPLSNAIRRNPNVITKEVTKVGNKYVYVGTLKFLKENGEQVTIYSGDYQLFYNKEDLDDIVEREELLKEFQTFVPFYGKLKITTDTLRRIVKILKQ